MKKTIYVGQLDNRSLSITIKFSDGRLSLTGQHGSGKRASGGQLIMNFKEYDNRGYCTLADLSSVYSPEKTKKLFDIWKRWHLNDMQAGSPKQMEYLRKNPVNVTYPVSYYDAASKMLALAGLNPDENGYKYGHSWMREEVPAEVIAFLESF